MSRGKKKMKQLTMNSIAIPMEAIFVDHEFNARNRVTVEKDGEEIEVYPERPMKELVANIKQTGKLLNPVLVRELSDDDKAEIGEQYQYQLVAGFRRYSAFEILKYEAISANVLHEEDAYTARIANLSENMARNELSAYEQAVRLHDLQEENPKELTGPKLAAMFGKGKSYINQLIRFIRFGHPDILEQWRLNHNKASTDNLNKIITAERDHDEQLQLWTDLLEGKTIKPDKPEKSGDDGEGKEGKNKKKSAKDIRGAIECAEWVAENEDGHADYAQGVINALRWALGESGDKIKYTLNQRIKLALDKAKAAEAAAAAYSEDEDE